LKGKWGLTAEYRHRVQKFNGGSLNAENFTTFYDSSISTAFPTNIPTLESLNPYNHAVAGKVAYQWTEKYKPYIIAQTTLGAEKPGKLLRVGLEARINDLTRITLETSVGNIGDGSIVGIERDVSEDTSMYVQWKTIDTLDFGKVENTTVGSTTRLRSGGRVFTERQMDSYRLGSQVSELIGYEKPINERITYGANYERSRVDSFNEVFDRNVVGGEITFKDFGRLKRSGHRLEVRMDNDPADAQQWLTQHAAEFRLSEDYTLAGRLNWSRTNETSLDTLFANFTELNVGIAYRPVKHDWLNGLMRYTHLDSESTPGQYGTGVQTREKSHIFAIEGAFDVNKYFQIVQKYAYKSGISRAEGSGDIRLRDFLWINRVNFHVTRKWDIGAEYRILAETGDVKNMRQGMLVEVSRDIQELVRIGAGYNFTDFNDDLRKSDNYQSQGFFLRLTGKY